MDETTEGGPDTLARLLCVHGAAPPYNLVGGIMARDQTATAGLAAFQPLARDLRRAAVDE